ncbi:ATP-dependent nuclease [Serratia fonticola]|uniref:ATP-dependent nuclease n=1 Tax=Serratia fonticola TaxID=47917 RepID=UPI0015C66262|nr:AAA family ATPase [Serratia fonticola]NYA45636.1 AAA family ATPase [Serratia fonticola]CAI0758023.1 Predicted ATPase [Serratia fonticola]
MLEKITLTSGTTPSQPPLEIQLAPLTIFVGPNNSGKSAALIEIENWLTDNNPKSGDVINNLLYAENAFENIENELKDLKVAPLKGEKTYDDHILIGKMVPINNTVARFNLPLPNLLREAREPNKLPRHYLCQYTAIQTLKLDGKNRLQLIEDQESVDLQNEPSSTFSFLFKNNNIRAELSRIACEAFNKYLVVDPTNMGKLRLRLSKKPPKNESQERGWDEESVNFHGEANLVTEASDGVKAFIGMMSTLIASKPKVTLIDEPEAFLHPALCTKLGKEISRTITDPNQRVFVATHSANFLMGCIQGGSSVNIVRLTYDYSEGTARVLTKEQLTPLMRNPLLRSVGVLNALFYHAVIVTEADADRAFYQEINERLLANNDSRGIEGCLFLNAQNKQTVWDIVKPLRDLGIPAIGIVDIDVIKEGGVTWKKPLIGAHFPEVLHESFCGLRSKFNTAFENTNKNMKTQGGIKLLNDGDREGFRKFLDDLSEYGVFVVPHGEIEAWLTKLDINRNKHSWLSSIFEAMGDNPDSPDYVNPTEGDVWDFIGDIKKWISTPNRKGIPK